MVNKYIKRPQEFEAIQFIGNNFDEIKRFCPMAAKFYDTLINNKYHIGIKIPNGGYIEAQLHDYIIKDYDGNFYVENPTGFKFQYKQI